MLLLIDNIKATMKIRISLLSQLYQQRQLSLKVNDKENEKNDKNHFTDNPNQEEDEKDNQSQNKSQIFNCSTINRVFIFIILIILSIIAYRFISRQSEFIFDDDISIFNSNPQFTFPFPSPSSPILDEQEQNIINQTSNQAKSIFTSTSSFLKGVTTAFITFFSQINNGRQYFQSRGASGVLFDIGAITFSTSFDFVLNNFFLILLFGVVLLILLKIKSYIHNRSIANSVYKTIRDRLKKISDCSNSYDHGIAVDEIIYEYSLENGMGIETFSNVILPLLNNLRMKDRQVRVFQKEVNGKVKVYWQWN